MGTAFLVPQIRHGSKGLGRIYSFALGVALPLTVTLYFKVTNNVQNYVIAYEPGRYQKLFDFHRHELVWHYFAQYVFSFGQWTTLPYLPLLAILLLLGIDRQILTNQGWQTLAAILVIMVAGYYYIYLTTPVPLEIHITTSMDRLLLQLWPSFLLLAGLSCQRSDKRSGDLWAPLLLRQLD